MANIANFVSVLIAKNVLKTIFFFTILLHLVLICIAKETNSKSLTKEFQNGEDDVEIFANFNAKEQENKFGQLKNRVVVVNGKTVVGGVGKTDPESFLYVLVRFIMYLNYNQRNL